MVLRSAFIASFFVIYLWVHTLTGGACVSPVQDQEPKVQEKVRPRFFPFRVYTTGSQSFAATKGPQVIVAREEKDRQGVASSRERGLQVESVHSWHLQIGHDTARSVGIAPGELGLSAGWHQAQDAARQGGK